MDPLGSSSKNVKEGESSSKGENENSFLPGFATLEDYSKVRPKHLIRRYGGVYVKIEFIDK